MSETEENKALVRKFYEEAWVKGNADAVDEFIAANYVEHGLPTGAEGMK
jgi:predicted SnoaL-like aldol condensation-catalyzing enzyme